LDSLDTTLDSLAMELSDLFTFTDATTPVFISAQAAIDRIFADLGGINTNLISVNTILSGLTAAAKTSIGSSGVTIPTDIPSQITDATLKKLV
jgi:hypothetical protein